MAPPTASLRRGLALWIAATLATSGVLVVARQPEPETTLVASGDPDDSADERRDVTSTTAEPATTSTTATTLASTATAAVPTPTTIAPIAPATTAPPVTTTTAPVPTFSITPNGPLSASPGSEPDHYMLAGAGCPGARVVLRVHGGRFDDELYDVPSTLPDGTWGIGMMVAIPGTYEMRAACEDANGTKLFDYAPLTFTILP